MTGSLCAWRRSFETMTGGEGDGLDNSELSRADPGRTGPAAAPQRGAAGGQQEAGMKLPRARQTQLLAPPPHACHGSRCLSMIRGGYTARCRVHARSCRICARSRSAPAALHSCPRPGAGASLPHACGPCQCFSIASLSVLLFTAVYSPVRSSQNGRLRSSEQSRERLLAGKGLCSQDGVGEASCWRGRGELRAPRGRCSRGAAREG